MKRFKQSENVVTRKVVDELLLIPISGEIANLNRVFTLQDTGEFIWNQLSIPKTLEELVTAITNIYDVDNHTAKQDCIEIIDLMLKNSLILEVNNDNSM